MRCFRYKLDHDYGVAPNPFWGVLSLATCKAQLRHNKYLQIGDWIAGFGSTEMGNLGRLIYAMRVERILTFDEYWNSPEFLCKRPVLNGTLCQMYGDNVYHTVGGKVIQEHCAHSLESGEPNKGHYDTDVSGANVLLSREFYYFGDQAPEIPNNLNYMLPYRNVQFHDLEEKEDQIRAFVSWLESNYTVGIHGDPCNWKEFKLPKLDIYDDGIE